MRKKHCPGTLYSLIGVRYNRRWGGVVASSSSSDSFWYRYLPCLPTPPLCIVNGDNFTLHWPIPLLHLSLYFSNFSSSTRPVFSNSVQFNQILFCDLLLRLLLFNKNLQEIREHNLYLCCAVSRIKIIAWPEEMCEINLEILLQIRDHLQTTTSAI